MHGSDDLRDWADIRLFLAILDQGSLIAAAEFLGITQPTVGRRLAAMEERFETPLFVRSGRRMQLTDAGTSILESARRMEREMHTIKRSIEVQSKGLSGEVTISATEGTGTEWLTPVLFDFHQQYPDILVKVQIANRPVDLIHREADIALRLGRPTQAELIGRRLVTVGFGLYTSQSYIDKEGIPETLADLEKHSLVGLDMRGMNIEVDTVFPVEDRIEGNYVYLSNSPAGQFAAVLAGFGIGALSNRWAAMENRLIRILPAFTAYSVEMWLVTHEELRYSARIRAVADYIAERVLADAHLFEKGIEL